MGVERKSLIINDEEKRNTAYHEAGHALVAALMPGADPLHKVTIIPRGMALGVTMQLPLDDKHSYSKEYLEARLADPHGRADRRGDLHEAHHHRRRQRHRAGHGNGAQDGVRVGHERDGPAQLRQEGRTDLPGPRDRPAPGLQRRHRHQDRRARAQAGGEPATSAPGRSSRTTRTRWCGSPRRCSSAKCWTAARCTQLIEGLPLAPARTPPKSGGEDKPQPAVRPESGHRLPGLLRASARSRRDRALAVGIIAACDGANS